MILFDQNSQQVSKLCKQKKIPTIKPSPIIDFCAKSIFRNGEYRPGVKSWKYMRKLNCFLDASTFFLFLDLNCIPTAKLDPLVEAYINLKKDILFTSHSYPKRTIRVDTKQFLNLIDPTIEGGYNCSIIASRNNVLNESIFESLKGRNLRKMIAKAPEQGYLAIVMSLSNISHGLFHDDNEFNSHYRCASNQGVKKAMLDLDSASGNIIINLREENRTLITYKSTGSKLTNLTPQNLKIFEKSKIIRQALAKNSALAPETKNFEERTKPQKLNNKLQHRSKLPRKGDFKYILKLYSPFRAGSNLVKAVLEHNFSNIQVYNTGENHWKHAFHAQSKNYYGYIYCVRHPLNLIYSIQDYYFTVGRNMHSYGEKENFIHQPISIFNQGVHRGRSPILFPNPVALINAWYLNYLHGLKETHNKSSKILYEHMVLNQKRAIKNMTKKMNLEVQSDNFSPINAKTKNLGDRRFNIKKDLQGKIFNSKASLQRSQCGLSDTNLIRAAKQQDIDFIMQNVDWAVCNQLGYREEGLTNEASKPTT